MGGVEIVKIVIYLLMLLILLLFFFIVMLKLFIDYDDVLCDF